MGVSCSLLPLWEKVARSAGSGVVSASSNVETTRGEIPSPGSSLRGDPPSPTRGEGAPSLQPLACSPSRAAQQLARDDPVVAVELEHIAVLDRAEILRRGVEGDAGHQ